MDKDNYIYVDNLIRALEIAIEALYNYESKKNYRGKSAFRAGIEMNLEDLLNGYPLRIIYSHEKKQEKEL